MEQPHDNEASAPAPEPAETPEERGPSPADEPAPEQPSFEAEPEQAAEEPRAEEQADEEPFVPEPAAEATDEEAPFDWPVAPAAEPEVEPALAAAVEEAFEGVDAEVAPAGEVEVAQEAEPEWVPGEWYVVHTYAGYENKVKADLETRVASMNMEEAIFEVVIPMEEVVEVKSGKKVTVPRKIFPGYLLVRMELNDDSWYVVRNTPGVTGFVGSGNKPIPLSEKEVDKILQRKGEAERPKAKAEWQPNDPVRVTTGPFANFQGVISEVDDERQKVKVLVNIFGRETPVELAFDQIAKV